MNTIHCADCGAVRGIGEIFYEWEDKLYCRDCMEGIISDWSFDETIDAADIRRVREDDEI